MTDEHCRRCGQAFTEGADGYCQDCLQNTQADMLKQWNNLNDPED